MLASIQELRPYLQRFDLPGLFVEGLGWDRYVAEPFVVRTDALDYTLKPVAEKASFAVFQCDSDGDIPGYPDRRKIEAQVAKRTFEHLIVFVDSERTIQRWQWVKRDAGRPPACREQEFRTGQRGDPILQRLHDIAFDLEDEAKGIGISDVTDRVRRAFDVEKITKRFYERFQKELKAFGKFIEGITAQGDRDWYASLMLNRMMFVYFVQKQGFLDGNNDYLRTKLHQVQSRYGDGRFQQFYREFLLKLFHDGLGRPVDQRNQELKDLLGKVPFLNGGLFDQHELERDNPDISIPDEAFQQVFNFFDDYRWHLDERPHGEDNEINPDVLGYIFEKYVNQKQMGAYYTKEDITGYISRNTVIPFLFDAARKECRTAFGPDGGVWRLLQDDPDRYIYPAVGHGVTWNARDAQDPQRLDEPFDLPDDIAGGIDDVSQRDGWNAPAPDDCALPTETWREVVARRSRYSEVRAKLEAGEVREINDLITLNLDVQRFARDVIAQSEGPELLRAFWHALYGNRSRSDTGISVLDPTCGSGAFLFAALNILEPLYIACLEGMRGFLDDHARSERKRGPGYLSAFRDVLARVEEHHSERYFILKSIVLNNLYGVDIMEEAVEICKLRLFLKLVAQLESYEQIEPLPDIDFNIRAGNTLVGFTSLDAVRQAMTVMPNGQHRQVFPEDQATLDRIVEDAHGVDWMVHEFRRQQTMLGGEITPQHKSELRGRLRALADELDRLLATEYGIDYAKPGKHNVKPKDLKNPTPQESKTKCDRDSSTHDAYPCWRDSHQPFHWFVEFYGIMSKGGFDVVIGNPPYVKSNSIDYRVQQRNFNVFPDIYAHVILHSQGMKSRWGRSGFIAPLSMVFSRAFSQLRRDLTETGTHWFSSFDNIPAPLFSGVSQRCTIWIGASSGSRMLVTRLIRWRAAYRRFLFGNVTYAEVANDIQTGDFGIPRISAVTGGKLLNLHMRAPNSHSALDNDHSEATTRLGFSPTARNFISTYLEIPPVLQAGNASVLDSTLGTGIDLPSGARACASLAATAGDACFWYWLTRGDGFHVTVALLSEFLAPLGAFPAGHLETLTAIGRSLHEHRYSALVFKKNAGRYVGNYNYRKLSTLSRRADLVFLSGLGAAWGDAEALFSFVARVHSMNDSAGEKNIPKTVKDRFQPPTSWSSTTEQQVANVDKWLSSIYRVRVEQIRSVIHA